jgi:hypothetical protein
MTFVKIVKKIQKYFHDFTFNFSKLEVFFYDFGSNLKFVQFLMFCLDFFRCFLFRFRILFGSQIFENWFMIFKNCLGFF